MLRLPLPLGLLFVLALAPSAQAATIQWTTAVTNTNISLPENLIGAPDGAAASFTVTATQPEMVTATTDGSIATTYDTAALAALLGVATATVDDADVIAFERNGSLGVGFESGSWSFTDGTNTHVVDWEFGVGTTSPGVTGGSITNEDYSTFFGFPNTFLSGENVFLLIDVDGHSDVDFASPNFAVTLAAMGMGGGQSPDPDAIGFVVPVPEPSTGLLLALGLVGLVRRQPKRSLRAS